MFAAAWAARAQSAAGLALRSPLAIVSAASRPIAAPMPLARWLATRSRSTTAGPAPKMSKVASRGKKKAGADSNAPNTAAARAVLVKVGDVGRYSLVAYDALMAMDAMSLLKALRRDEGFALDLAGVSLQRCTVEVCASESNRAPSADQAGAAIELEGAKTLGVLAATALPGASLFVRVTLPASAAAAGDSE